MQAEPNVIEDIFCRASASDSVAVLDGFGIRLTVERGHLVLQDGIGPHRRERRYSRAERTLRRIVILGHTGHITLDAIRWCTDLGIVVVHLDPETGLNLHSVARTIDDARLRRAQAAAASTSVGVAITQALLGSKLDGQAAVAEQLGVATIAATIRDLVSKLRDCDDLAQCRELEAKASNVYFGAWASSVECRFTERDRQRVPLHWLHFSARRSPLHRGGRSPRNAATPVNALLNYCYSLAEAECRLAALAVGLDPGLGVIHTDKRDRDSLALDLLESLRPIVERQVLRLLGSRYLRASDFHETRQGACRVLAPLTHELATWMPLYTRAIAGHAEAVAHALAKSSPGAIALRTPLSRSNTAAQQDRGQRSRNRVSRAEPRLIATCRTCGVELTNPRRQLCEACWPVTRRRLAAQRANAANQALAKLRSQGRDPTNTEEAATKKSASLSRRKREELNWRAQADETSWDLERYQTEVLPALRNVPLSRLMEATGLSISACSRIRSGHLVPHRRHWEPLAGIGLGRSRPSK